MARRHLACLGALAALLVLPASALANSWSHDVTVTKIGAYQHGTGHFVWLSSGAVDECVAASPSNPVLSFDEANPGGKTMASLLMAALMAQRPVDVQVDGCQIVEVYLK